MDLSRRIDQLEIMDTEAVPIDVMRQALSFLEITNLYFGGVAVLLRYFETWSRLWPSDKTISILDIGTGGAEIPAAIVAWARKKGRRIHITGLDLVGDIVRIAAEKSRGISNISIRHGSFFDLAERGEKFDYVISSLLLHHIPIDQTEHALRAFDQLATRGVIISDLLRSTAGYWAVQAASFLLGNAIVRHDGPLSVRRAFRPEELESLARQTNLHYLKAQREPWFRVSLSGEKPAESTTPAFLYSTSPIEKEGKRATVVGAGPAGLSAAIGLLRSGYAVTVVEQRTAWQGRVCGAFLNPEAVSHLDWLGVLDEIKNEAVEVPRTFVTHGSTGKEIQTNRVRRTPLGIPRQRLEEILLERVCQEGGEIQMGVRYEPGDDSSHTNLVVLAGGRFSQVRHPGILLSRVQNGSWPKTCQDDDKWYGWNATFENIGQKAGDMSLHFYRGGYVGLLTFAKGQTNVCGLVRKKTDQPLAWENIFEEARRQARSFDQLVARAQRMNPWRGVGPLPFSRSMRQGGDFLLAGDAAAVGDPFMGEGNGRALGAGPMIHQILSRKSNQLSSGEIIRSYEKLWNRAYARRLRFGFWFRRALNAPVLFPIVVKVASQLSLSYREKIHVC